MKTSTASESGIARSLLRSERWSSVKVFWNSLTASCSSFVGGNLDVAEEGDRTKAMVVAGLRSAQVHIRPWRREARGLRHLPERGN